MTLAIDPERLEGEPLQHHSNYMGCLHRLADPPIPAGMDCVGVDH